MYKTYSYWIKKDHRLSPALNKMTTYTNNLYNVVNFYMRQCFIAKRNLSEGKPLDPLTQTTIDTINEHIVIFNQSNGNKHQQKPIDKNNGFCCQIFWQNYLKQHEDYSVKCEPTEETSHVIA